MSDRPTASEVGARIPALQAAAPYFETSISSMTSGSAISSAVTDFSQCGSLPGYPDNQHIEVLVETNILILSMVEQAPDLLGAALVKRNCGSSKPDNLEFLECIREDECRVRTTLFLGSRWSPKPSRSHPRSAPGNNMVALASCLMSLSRQADASRARSASNTISTPVSCSSSELVDRKAIKARWLFRTCSRSRRISPCNSSAPACDGDSSSTARTRAGSIKISLTKLDVPWFHLAAYLRRLPSLSTRQALGLAGSTRRTRARMLQLPRCVPRACVVGIPQEP